MRALRTVLLTFVAATTAYLAVLAVRPAARDAAPAALQWFGRPRSGPTIGVVALAIIALCVVSYRFGTTGGIGGVSLTIVLGLTAMNCLLDLPAGQAHDTWERAAMLIHERYRRAVGGSSPSRRPWSRLDEFYRGSNRRQVRNALWLVEQIGGHTWGDQEADVGYTRSNSSRDPMAQLAAMGFDREAALGMARAELEDWCQYYRKGGWKYGPTRDDERKTHPNLTDWPTVEGDPELLRSALTSLVETFSQLRELGYRSVPSWRRYRRTGVVTAEQRAEAWNWTSDSGHELRALPGDWVVEDDGSRWSVRDDIFRTTHEHVGGRCWRRTGFVSARRARPGEAVDTLEGTAAAEADAWIVRGERGERWPVSAKEFRRRYEGPVESN